MARGHYIRRSLWITNLKRLESQEASKANPFSNKPMEVSLTLTTLVGHQRVSTGLARPI